MTKNKNSKKKRTKTLSNVNGMWLIDEDDRGKD